MRKLVLGVLIGFLVAATAAFAYDVTFPSRLRVQAHALVDELGNVLLGSTPAKIEVTNLPSEERPWSATGSAISGAQAVNLGAVPAGYRLAITDIEGTWSCVGDGWCELRSGTDVRLVWGNGQPWRSYTSGVVFEAGETVTWTSGQTFASPLVSGSLTLMGRLYPAL